MVVPFDSLSDNARIWVYQASRKLEVQEEGIIHQMVEEFLSQWQAHGREMLCGYELRYGHFLIIGAEEAHQQATGCATDAQVRMVQNLGSKLHIDFLDRSKIAFFVNNQTTLVSVADIKQEIENRNIKENTLIFNNLVYNKMELREHWMIKTEDSWMKKYFKKSGQLS